MIAWLTRIFARKERKLAKMDRVRQEAETIRADAEERIRAAYQAASERRRVEWEAKNELEKKLDACWLGTRRKAFYGTYEEHCACRGQQAQASFPTHSQAAQMANVGMQMANVGLNSAMQMAHACSGAGGILGNLGGILGR